MNDGMGTSLVLVHSQKAEVIWNEITKKMQFREVDPETAIQWNPMAVQSTPYQENREEFLEDIKMKTFQNWYGSLPQSQYRRNAVSSEEY